MLVPRSMSTKSTRAPDTLKPDGSETCPETVAVSNCAKATVAVNDISASRSSHRQTIPAGRCCIGFVSSNRNAEQTTDFHQKKFLLGRSRTYEERNKRGNRRELQL